MIQGRTLRREGGKTPGESSVLAPREETFKEAVKNYSVIMLHLIQMEF